jgi:SAM-dependent methyltransferase
MLDAVRRHARGGGTLLVRADAERLPLADASLDGVFAAGLLPHASDPTTGLRELARVTRPGGRLILFHPSGRAALAARHRRAASDDDTFARLRLTTLLSSVGWLLDRYDDAEHRFYALARRRWGRASSVGTGVATR